jgi:hypothetical protein
VSCRCRARGLTTNLLLVNEERHDEEDTMSDYTFGPALQSELDYRRTTLLHDADTDRLARQARLGTRAVRATRRVLTGSRVRTTAHAA